MHVLVPWLEHLVHFRSIAGRSSRASFSFKNALGFLADAIWKAVRKHHASLTAVVFSNSISPRRGLSLRTDLAGVRVFTRWQSPQGITSVRMAMVWLETEDASHLACFFFENTAETVHGISEDTTLLPTAAAHSAALNAFEPLSTLLPSTDARSCLPEGTWASNVNRAYGAASACGGASYGATTTTIAANAPAPFFKNGYSITAITFPSRLLGVAVGTGCTTNAGYTDPDFPTWITPATTNPAFFPTVLATFDQGATWQVR